MEFNLSRPGKPEKNRSDRKEKIGSPSRSEERLREYDKRKREKEFEKAEGFDDATTQIVTEDVSPVPAKIGEKKEEENNKLRDIENEGERLLERGIEIYNTLVKEGKKEERKEVMRMIKELEAVRDSDAATIQGVIDKVGSVLENIEEKKEEEDNRSREIENEFKSLVRDMDIVSAGMLSGRMIGNKWEVKQEFKSIDGEFGYVFDRIREVEEGSNDTKIRDVIEEMRSVLEKFEKLEKLEGERKRLIDMGEDVFYSLSEEERKGVHGIIIKLYEAQGHDINTIHGVINKARPMLESLKESLEIEKVRKFCMDWGENIKMLMDLGENIYDSIDNGMEKERGNLEEVIEELKEAQGRDIATIQRVTDRARSVLEKIEKEHESEIKIKHRRKTLMDWGEGIRDSIDRGEPEKREKIERAIKEFERVQGFDAAADQVKRIIEVLEKMQGFDDGTVQIKVDEVVPVLEPWFTEEKSRNQEVKESVRNDLDQIELMLIREKPDSFANFQESLSEVEAVMKSGDVDGARKQLNLLQETDEYRALLSRHKERSAQIEQDFFRYEKELPESLHEEAREERDRLLESQGKLPMSKEDFDRYFSSEDFEISADLKQKNVGDCYLIAAIHAMSRSPNFELFCRSSMERLHDGSWRVKIPLLSEDGEWVTVTKEEILPQKNEEFLSWSWHMRKLDSRRKLEPVEGKEGLQVLEAAHIKKRFSAIDRLAAEGGRANEALMLFGGDNFARFSIISGAWNSEAWENYPLKNLDSERANFLDSLLENFDPEMHMVTVSTSSFIDNSPYRYTAAGTELVSSHAYSIAGVNAEERRITLANPWDTSHPIEMSFDHFKESFSDISAARIDNENLLLNMRAVDQETG